MKTAIAAAIAILLPLAATPQESGQAFIDLGIKALGTNNPDQAFDYFDRVRNADSSLAATADLWMGIVRERQKRMGEAEGFYRDAIFYQSLESPDAVPALRILARLLRSENRPDEAAPLEARAKEAQRVAEPPIPASVYRVGKGITPPGVLSKVDPQYSEQSRLAKLTGTVILSAEIDPDGLAHNVTVIGKLGMGLDEEAVDAVKRWHFNPATKDGQPVPVVATIEVNFQML